VKRDAAALERGPFDLLVVGGGIYGAWTALDAALRGMHVALVERDDWAAGTSSASSKLIHGGLRYLEYGRLGLVRDALAERARLARLAPHQVWPLELLLPVRAGARVGRARLAAGLWLYDRLCGSDRTVPRHRRLSRDALLADCPALRDAGLRGGFAFGDCQTDDARLVVEIVDAALGAGAAAVNRVGVTGLLSSAGRVAGASLLDRESGRTLELRARVVVNCAGPWAAGIAAPGTTRLQARLSRGVHLALPPLPGARALVLPASARGRIVFLLPWYGVTLVGTTDTEYPGDPDEVGVEARDVDYLLEQANAWLDVGWTRGDVVAGFAGLRTFPAGGGATADASRRVHLERPAPGLLAPLGGKYTSARADAETIVDRAEAELGRTPPQRRPTRDAPLPWSPPAPAAAWLADAEGRGRALGLERDVAAALARRHGRRVDRLLERVAARPDLGRRILDHRPFCWAEIVHAVEDEMALDLRDVLRRRVPLLAVAAPDAAVLRRAAELAGDCLGWSVERRRAEASALAVPTVPR